jgi:ankyrin repeat protein
VISKTKMLSFVKELRWQEVREALSESPDLIAVRDKRGRNWLAAVQWSRYEAAEELLKLGVDPNYQGSKGMTALHHMLKKGADKKHIHMFLDYGARGDIQDQNGLTAAAIMMRKRDPEYRRIGARLLKSK